ncbi:MAG: sugar phosphate nucleotidyltransferase [Acidimicrobiia bacterium]
MTVEIAVIPCAGSGTRMRPATRVIPKAMIPVVDRPVIQYVVEEAVACGVSQIVFVVDERVGNPVMSHFTEGEPIPGLEGVTFTAVSQNVPRGLGDAVLRTAAVVGEHPFICLLSDNMFAEPAHAYTRSLIEVFDGRPVVAVREVGGELLDRYGVVAISGPVVDGVVEVTGAIEKPGVDRAPSSLGIVGRYLFPASVFGVLSAVDPGHGGELQLTDAIHRMALEGGARGRIVDDSLLDIGVPLGLAEATTSVALARPDLAPAYRAYLQQVLGKP